MVGAFLVTKEPLEKIIQNDMKSNIKYATVTTLNFSEETGDLSESLTLENETQKSNYGYNTLILQLKQWKLQKDIQRSNM